MSNVLPTFFKKGPIPASFIIYFWSFQTNIIPIFKTNICEKMSIQYWCLDSNQRPSEHESPPITTGPGLPPTVSNVWKLILTDPVS